MKVLHINAGLESGGGLTHIVNLLSQAKKAGQAFDLLTFAEGPVAQAAREKGIKTIVLGGSSRYDLALLKRLKKTIKDGRYNLVHSHGARANLFVSLIKSSLPCPWLITVHSDPAIDFERRGIAGKIFTKLNLRAIKQADGVFAITPRFEKILLNYGVKPSRIHVIYNGIDFRDNRNIAGKEDHAGFNIINVGRLEKVKGQDLLLKAFKAANLPQAHLYIAGSGSQEADLKKSRQDLALTNQVTFTGFLTQAELRQLYRKMDLAILSSYSESFPLVLLEAADNLLPLLATDVGGARELIPEGKGWVVPVNEEKAMADQLRAIAALPKKELAAIAQTEKAYARQHFSLDRQLADVLAGYQACLQGEKA